MGESERVSNHGPHEGNAFAEGTSSAELLRALRGFRVEWDDGSVGVAGEMAIFVRTPGMGTGHEKIELLAADAVVAILLEQRRILARMLERPAAAIGAMIRHALGRRLRRGLGQRRPHLLSARGAPSAR